MKSMCSLKSIAGGMALSLLLLGGCNNSVEQTSSALEVIEQNNSQLVEEITRLIDLEENLQSRFEEALQESSTLESFSNGTASVQENTEERREIIDRLNKKKEELIEQYDVLTKVNDDSVPEEKLTAVTSTLDGLHTSLDSFNSSYRENIDQQKNYFTSLGGEDATYETFNEGIEAINSERQETQQLLVELDRHLVDLQDNKEQLRQDIEPETGENNEGE